MKKLKEFKTKQKSNEKGSSEPDVFMLQLLNEALCLNIGSVLNLVIDY